MSPQFCHWPQDGISQMEIPLRPDSSSVRYRSQATVLKQALKASKSSCKTSIVFCWFGRFGHPELRWAFTCQTVTLSYLFLNIYIYIRIFSANIYNICTDYIQYISPRMIFRRLLWLPASTSLQICWIWNDAFGEGPAAQLLASCALQGQAQPCPVPKVAWHLSLLWTLHPQFTSLQSCTSLTLEPHDPT